MIYTKRELEEFERTKAAFEKAYEAALERIYHIFKKKGETRDVGAPIHHRLSPTQMLSEAQAKCRRIEAILSRPERWETDPALVAKVAEESGDIANYMAFLAALCSLLSAEEEE